MIYNMAPNPSFADGFESWSLMDVQYSRTLETSGGWDGDEFCRVVAAVTPDASAFGLIDSAVPIGVRPGVTYTYSLYARPVAGAAGKQVQVTIFPRDADGVLLTPIRSWHTLAAGWNRYAVTAVMPLNAAVVDLTLFDHDQGTNAPSFAVGDGVDIDAVMLNDGAAAGPYTNTPPPLRRAGQRGSGRNYDPNQLRFLLATPGFILGEGILGTNELGGDSALTELDKDYTSCTVNEPCTVEDGLFVHREVQSCTLTSTLPDLHLSYRGLRLVVQYGRKTLFAGTIRQATVTEAVSPFSAIDADGFDVTTDYRPGDTYIRTHRIALRATAGTEPLAVTATPPRDFDLFDGGTRDRLKSYMSLPILGDDYPADPDVDSGVMDNLAEDLAGRWRVRLTDEFGTLVETFRNLCRRTNRYYRLERGSGWMDTESISRVASGGGISDAKLAGGLRFTDHPNQMTGGDEFYRGRTGTGRTVSYTELTRGEDPSMFCTGVAVTVGADELGTGTIEAPLTVEVKTGGTIDRYDAEIDLGNVDYLGRRAQSARNFIATLPLKQRPTPFVTSITAPLQSEHQVQNRIPGIATLSSASSNGGEGGEELVAIIGIAHTITPDRWMIQYDCAPPHLLTRESDWDPSPPRDLAVSDNGDGTLRVEWRTPRSLPQDVPLFATVFRHSNANAGGEVVSDTGHVWYAHLSATGEQPGDLQFTNITKPAPGGYFFAVQYTSAPATAVAAGAFDPTWRNGQPTTVSYFVT